MRKPWNKISIFNYHRRQSPVVILNVCGKVFTLHFPKVCIDRRLVSQFIFHFLVYLHSWLVKA